MCFFSSVVGHHPSVPFQSHGGEQAMIVDVDDKGQVVTGRWNAKTYQSYVSDLTDNVKTTVLFVLNNKSQVRNMKIFARFNLTMREQDTAVLYIYVRLVGEHYQPGLRDPGTIIATVRHVSNEMLFEAVTMAEAGETDRIQTFIVLTSSTSHIINDRPV